MQKRYTAAVFTVKTPLYFCLMRICEGNFRTEEQKNGSPEIPFDKSESIFSCGISLHSICTGTPDFPHLSGRRCDPVPARWM